MLIGIDPEPASETLTALGRIPLLVQTFRSLGLAARVERQVRIKQRQKAGAIGMMHDILNKNLAA